MELSTPDPADYAVLADINNRADEVFAAIYSDDEKAAFGDTFPVEAGEFVELAEARELLCAKEHGNVCGFAVFRRKNAQTVWISSLYVDPLRQRGGIGSLLLQGIEQYAQAQKCVTVALETHAKADWAVRFYMKNAYDVVNDSIAYAPYGYILDKPPVDGRLVFAKNLLSGDATWLR